MSLPILWFGDALSPVDFKNIWLNEGFATFCAARWAEVHYGEQYFREVTLHDMAESYFYEDRIFRYAAYDPPPDYMFGAVIYPKSGYVLQMLREQLFSDELFFQAMSSYVSSHLYGTVSTEDFIASINAAAGQRSPLVLQSMDLSSRPSGTGYCGYTRITNGQ